MYKYILVYQSTKLNLTYKVGSYMSPWMSCKVKMPLQSLGVSSTHYVEKQKIWPSDSLRLNIVYIVKCLFILCYSIGLPLLPLAHQSARCPFITMVDKHCKGYFLHWGQILPSSSWSTKVQEDGFFYKHSLSSLFSWLEFVGKLCPFGT